jgi:hypothetical protein
MAMKTKTPTPPPNEGELSAVDIDAMTRAIAIIRAESFASREQIDDKLASEPWEEVGHFAAYAAQDRALRLRPWEMPPCWIRDPGGSLAQPHDDHRGERRAAELLKKLLAGGLSRYEPDPIVALAAADARKSGKLLAM